MRTTSEEKPSSVISTDPDSSDAIYSAPPGPMFANEDNTANNTPRSMEKSFSTPSFVVSILCFNTRPNKIIAIIGCRRSTQPKVHFNQDRLQNV
jgi:hypothetical protein